MVIAVALTAAVVVVFVVVFVLLRHTKSTQFIAEWNGRNKRILFVTAHPDDECMFFAPIILTLSESGQFDIFLLCLSIGDYYGQGRQRQDELMKSCRLLGIRQTNVFVLNRKDLQDHPEVTWDTSLVAELIGDFVREYYIDQLFTFDEYGVSGHLNHKAVYHGVRQFLSRRDQQSGVTGYKLLSVNLLRKYSSVIDVPLSYVLSRIVFIARWSQFVKAQAAMSAHQSQFVWFRALYVVLSRYMIINTFEKIIRQTATKVS